MGFFSILASMIIQTSPQHLSFWKSRLLLFFWWVFLATWAVARQSRVIGAHLVLTATVGYDMCWSPTTLRPNQEKPWKVVSFQQTSVFWMCWNIKMDRKVQLHRNRIMGDYPTISHMIRVASPSVGSLSAWVWLSLVSNSFLSSGSKRLNWFLRDKKEMPQLMSFSWAQLHLFRGVS